MITGNARHEIPGMRLQVLGPTAITARDGTEVPLRRLERQVVAVLLLRAPQPCSADMLADALWGEELPRHPSSTLRIYVSRVRGQLAEHGLDPGLMPR
jgi:DNA-binding SARP family transcriptional activator